MGSEVAKYDWKEVPHPPTVGNRWYQCGKTGTLGYSRLTVNGAMARRIVPFVCTARGCRKRAVTRLPGTDGRGKYRWVCEDHQDSAFKTK